MIDHVSVPVRSLAAAQAFYTAALKPLGYSVMMAGEGFCGFQSGGKPDFWLSERGPSPSVHVCFRAADRAMVEAFHAAALAAGATDNGAPGIRAMYHPGYFGAFVIDPDGHNVEAVFHDPELMRR